MGAHTNGILNPNGKMKGPDSRIDSSAILASWVIYCFVCSIQNTSCIPA